MPKKSAIGPHTTLVLRNDSMGWIIETRMEHPDTGKPRTMPICMIPGTNAAVSNTLVLKALEHVFMCLMPEDLELKLEQEWIMRLQGVRGERGPFDLMFWCALDGMDKPDKENIH